MLRAEIIFFPKAFGTKIVPLATAALIM